MRQSRHNARYAKLRRQVGKENFHVRNLIGRGVTNLRLLRPRADLFSYGAREKQVIGEGLIKFLGIASNQPHILALYV